MSCCISATLGHCTASASDAKQLPDVLLAATRHRNIPMNAPLALTVRHGKEIAYWEMKNNQHMWGLLFSSIT